MANGEKGNTIIIHVPFGRGKINNFKVDEKLSVRLEQKIIHNVDQNIAQLRDNTMGGVWFVYWILGIWLDNY